MSQTPLAPEESPVPLMGYDKAVKLGLDVSKVRTCCVPKKDEIAGCPMAQACARRMFGLEDLGGFGPKNARPGTPGDRPHNIGYYRFESSTKTEKEDIMPCFTFMVSLFDMYEQQNQTGDVIEIVAQEGEKITQREVLPKEPGLCNKTGNLGMNEVAKVVEVPAFPEYESTSPSMNYALELRKNRAAAARAGRRERIAPLIEPPADETPTEGKAEAGPVKDKHGAGAGRDRRGA